MEMFIRCHFLPGSNRMKIVLPCEPGSEPKEPGAAVPKEVACFGCGCSSRSSFERRLASELWECVGKWSSSRNSRRVSKGDTSFCGSRKCCVGSSTLVANGGKGMSEEEMNAVVEQE